MPFNPSVTDQRGAIAAQSGANIADILLSGSKSLASGISSMGSNIGGGIADAGQQIEVEKKRRGIAEGKLGFLVENNVVTQEQATKLLSGSTSKLEGAVGMGEAKYSLINQYAKDDRSEARNLRYLDAQTNAAANIATYKSALGQTDGPDQDEIDRMTKAGYVWDRTGKDWKPDRSKNQSSDPWGNFINGGVTPTAVPQASPSATAAPVGAPVSSIPQYKEGQTATGPNGVKKVYRNGAWTPQ